MGDEIMYFRKGYVTVHNCIWYWILIISFLITVHEYYVDTVKERNLFEIPSYHLPWSTQTICEQELAKIIGIHYEIIGQLRFCCVTVSLIANRIF